MRHVFMLFFIYGLSAGASTPQAVYKDPTAAIPDRVHDLVSRMTLDEKIDFVAGDQFQTKPNARLGIPPLKMTDGPIGIRWDKSTAFPSGISMGASFDRDLMYRVASAMAVEARAEGRDMQLGPCVGLSRVPFGGRNFESMGEDPYLTAEMVTAYVHAQNDHHILGSVKHFALNDQEYRRMDINSTADERTMHEVHLVPYERAVQEGVGTVMASYNKINGLWATENPTLLTSILKQQWGFTGFVVSDWGAVHSTIPAALAGTDLEMPEGDYFNSNLLQAVKAGQVPESLIDDKVSRILGQMFRIGLFDGADKMRPDPSVVNSFAHRDLALQLARESIVLLKNDRAVLPLDMYRVHKIALLGPNADRYVAGGGSSEVDPASFVTALDGLRDRVGSRASVEFAEGASDDQEAIADGILTPALGAGNGLYAEYFDNMDLQGAPVVTRVDPTIDFSWDPTDTPDPKVPGTNFSVRWTGDLHAPVTGKYDLHLQSDDGVRLWVDGKLVVDDWSDHGTQDDDATVTFTAGKSYKIRLEYYQHGGGARIQLAWTPPESELLKQAVKVARNSDVAVIVAGFNQNLESEGNDRNTFDLPASQVQLIEAVAKVNPRTIVVINTGNPVSMQRWMGKVAAILYAWYPGGEGGPAIADLLLGNENPSGRLPVTMLKRWQDSPAYGTYPEVDGTVPYKEGIYVGYRYYDTKGVAPLYPFGYGLSYTKFIYSDIKVSAADNSADTPLVDVSFTVKNDGSREGAEVAQVYIQPHDPKVDRPFQELKDFEKVFLLPGESRTIHVTLTQRAFAYYDVNTHAFRADPGHYTVRVGASSRDIRLTGDVDLTGEKNIAPALVF